MAACGGWGSLTLERAPSRTRKRILPSPLGTPSRCACRTQQQPSQPIGALGLPYTPTTIPAHQCLGPAVGTNNRPSPSVHTPVHIPTRTHVSVCGMRIQKLGKVGGGICRDMQAIELESNTPKNMQTLDLTFSPQRAIQNCLGDTCVHVLRGMLRNQGHTAVSCHGAQGLMLAQKRQISRKKCH